MGTAVQGGKWCPQCAKPVAGQKTTHRLSSAVGMASGLAPFGLSEGYHCPTCGGPVITDPGPQLRPTLDANGKVQMPEKTGPPGIVDRMLVNPVFWGVALVIGAQLILNH